ncbi:MAG: tripartite tricarboxylate transporter substrate binding protein [Alcaligenaceae bacterium]|nr:tripartite tricarboxylate transporter substrate binding protein [Alcaligenaceae bacterium]
MRFIILATLTLATAFFGMPMLSVAADYPSEKPIKMVVGFTPGGAADKLARPVADRMAKFLGQTIVMEYKPGVAGGIALELVARAPADGYTIHLTSQGPMTFGPSLRKAKFDPLNDFTPIGMVSSGGSLIAVLPTSAAKDVKSFIALAKANPAQWSYGTSGIGGSGHLAAEQFKLVTGLQIAHVPYKGGAGALTDLLGGHIPILFSSIGSIATNVEAGQVKALAVSSLTRSSLFPNVPTIAESGFPGFDSPVWFGVVAPAGLTANVTSKLVAALNAAMGDPEILRIIRQDGYEPLKMTPEQMKAAIQTELKQWAELITRTGMKAD